MRIYFAASIRGAGSDLALAREVVSRLESAGHTVINGDVYLSEHPDEKIPDPLVFDRDMRMLREADVLIADITNPSLGVGYEICEAVHLGKPVIVFFKRDSRVSKLILGNPALHIVPFSTLQELEISIESFLQRVMMRGA
ncbi:MAG: nucleoside 2-deoxyribosyltransferase [Candidatus Korarchaeota archaeon]|nr:nucleoside 2-deoxyribosyltransferase [Candidatus Korarchaeota archaeon]